MMATQMGAYMPAQIVGGLVAIQVSIHTLLNSDDWFQFHVH